MPAIEPELQALKDNLNDMLTMVRVQMSNCKEAIEKKDIGLAKQVIDDEKKVNIQELAIDRDCENILALYTPVATDLRLVLASLKITNDLERIGDSAKSLAKFLVKEPDKEEYQWMQELQFVEMLDVLVGMLKDMGSALRKEDTKSAIKTAKKDDDLNSFYKKGLKTTADLVKTNPDKAREILTLFMLARNLERAGDLTKNIAEEIVFHIEARVVKHKGSKKS